MSGEDSSSLGEQEFWNIFVIISPNFTKYKNCIITPITVLSSQSHILESDTTIKNKKDASIGVNVMDPTSLKKKWRRSPDSAERIGGVISLINHNAMNAAIKRKFE